MKKKNKIISKLTDTKWDSLITKKEDIAYSKVTGKRLLSFSTFTKLWAELSMQSVPKWVLDNAAIFGKNIMEHMRYLYENKVKYINEYDFFSEEEKVCVLELIKHIQDEGFKIADVEQLITNNYWYGYFDLLLWKRNPKSINYCEYKLVEIKTTSSNEGLLFRHKLQLCIYASLLHQNNLFTQYRSRNLKLEVWIYNTKTHTLTTHPVSWVEFKQIMNWLNDILERFNLKEYMLQDVRPKTNTIHGTRFGAKV